MTQPKAEVVARNLHMDEVIKPYFLAVGTSIAIEFRSPLPRTRIGRLGSRGRRRGTRGHWNFSRRGTGEDWIGDVFANGLPEWQW